MSAPFEVLYSDSAREDLIRLFDFFLDRAKTSEDFGSAQVAIAVIRDTVERSLSRAPFVYRKAGSSSFLREMVIPFSSRPCKTSTTRMNTGVLGSMPMFRSLEFKSTEV